MSSATAQPLPDTERIATLDIVRGIALLGILIMNMPGFANSFFVEADGSRLWTQPIDRVAEALREMLFSGKFNSMFSLLFGIGFTLQYARLREREPQRATRLYLRRLGVLLVFGLVHLLVFWPGDVLHVYAVLGVVLLVALRHAPERVIVGLIVACLLYPAVAGGLRLAFVTPDVTARLVAEAQGWEASNNLAYGHGSFWDAAREHVREAVYGYTNPWPLYFNLGFYLQMTTTMLLGVLIGRRGWVRRIPELMPWIGRLQWWALGLGIACSVGFGIVNEIARAPGPSPLKLLGSVCYGLSRLGLMSFYVLTVVRLAQQPAWARRFAPIAAAGRMPLTNYLMQTAICTTLFYGWGFGLWGRVGPAAGLALAVAIYAGVQLPWSVWWLRRHGQGPLEALWRRLTYRAEPADAEPSASSRQA